MQRKNIVMNCFHCYATVLDAIKKAVERNEFLAFVEVFSTAQKNCFSFYKNWRPSTGLSTVLALNAYTYAWRYRFLLSGSGVKNDEAFIESCWYQDNLFLV